MSAEEDVIPQTEVIEIASSGVFAIETHTAVALDAAVHFVVHERSEILIVKGALLERIAAIVMTGHHGHVLQMTLSALIADRTVVGVVDHQPFNHTGAKRARFRVFDRNPRAFGGRRHAGHHDLSLLVLIILELLHSALPAGADRAHRGVPAEIRKIEAESQAGV